MKTFLTIWFGQFISQIGTALTRFALLLWVYQQNQQAMDVALFGLFAFSQQGVTAAATRAGASLWPDFGAGLTSIRARPGLIGLLLFSMLINFVAALTFYATLSALILGRSGGDEFALAVVQSTLGGAAVVGSLFIGLWGGPRRKIHGVLLGAGASFLLGDLLFGMGRTLPHWVVAALFSALSVPLMDSSNMAILQAKVAPAMQGRFFALFHTARQLFVPVGYLLGGWLVDEWLEPALAPAGVLVAPFGWLVGVGPGAGCGLLFIATALLGTTVCFGGYLFPALRNVEDDLADHDAEVADAYGNQALAQMV